MPNHIENRITFTGEKEEIQRIMDAVISLDDEGKKFFDFKKIKPIPGNIYCGDLGIEERNKYGKNNWYDWCCENWGTKWGSYNNKVTDDCIEFQTAWSHPKPIVKAFAEMFPQIEFTWEYADEDTGHNTGSYIAKDGKMYFHDIEDKSDEAYEIYIKLHGETQCLRKNEDGEWQHYECGKETCPNWDKC